jgi:mitogen-activated protein kinase kinase kinase 1
MVGEPKASDRRAGIAFKEPLAKQGDGDTGRHASNKEHRHSSSLAPLQWRGKHAESSSGQQEPPREHVANDAEEGPIVGALVVPVPPEHRAAEQSASVVPAENSATEQTASVVPAEDSATEQTACDEFVSDASNEPSWNSWKKGDLLGSGSFGTVYEAVGDNGCFFAVKEVSLSEQDSQAKQAIMQLEQEITLLRKFQHDNIVQYLGTQMEVDKLYIFLELVSKGSLASLYRKYGVMFPDQVRTYTQQILRGLKYLHDRHIVHRDIKCANILVDVNGVVKLADFGMAKQVAKLDMLKSCKGSAYWMAPEVIDPTKSYNVAADIWSLGCTVLEMATGSPPFGDLEWLRVLWTVGHGEVPPIPEDLPPAMIDFIAGCLEVNVMKRPTVDMLLVHPFVTGMPELGLPRFVGPAGLPNIEELTSLELTIGTETVEEESTNSVVVVRRQVHSSEFSMSSLPEEPHQSHS